MARVYSDFRMRFLLSTVFLAASTLSMPDLSVKSEGLCMDTDMLHAMCIMGSPFEQKMESALMACSNDEVTTMRARKQPGKNQRCPSFKIVMSEIEDDFAEEACVLFNLGWIDEQGNPNDTATMADIMTLEPALLEKMSEDEVTSCTVKKLAKSPMAKKCAKKYNEKQQAKLEEAAGGIVGFRCFMAHFTDACREFVTETYIEPFLIEVFNQGGNATIAG